MKGESMPQKCTYPGCDREDIQMQLNRTSKGRIEVARLCTEHYDTCMVQVRMPDPRVWISETDANE
jgi:hypothetical protein